MIRKKVVHIEKKVVLYSTGCPKCRVLEAKLNEKHIQYEVNSSVDDMEALGLMELPALDVDGELYNFVTAVKWANSQ